MNRHEYTLTCRWTGDLGEGTRSYQSYSRQHRIDILGKPALIGSSDPAFLGDPAWHNPEELLLASISACHMLWYLHLCSANKLVLREYTDAAQAWMEENESGGAFTLAVLRPHCRFDNEEDEVKARNLHHEAHRLCFVANSLNFPVRCEPVIELPSNPFEPV